MKKVLNVIFQVLKYCYLVFLGIYLIFIFLHRISIDTDILGYRITSITNSDMEPKYKVEERHPLCGIGVTSTIDVTSNPAVCRERIAVSRPGPSPFT